MAAEYLKLLSHQPFNTAPAAAAAVATAAAAAAATVGLKLGMRFLKNAKQQENQNVNDV